MDVWSGYSGDPDPVIIEAKHDYKCHLMTRNVIVCVKVYPVFALLMVNFGCFSFRGECLPNQGHLRTVLILLPEVPYSRTGQTESMWRLLLLVSNVSQIS